MNRPGCEFALVGPHFISSCACRSVASLTGRSVKTLWVRAVRRIASRHFSSVIIAPVIDLASVIRPGDGIICGQACAEAQTLMEALVAQRAAFSGAGLFLGVNYAGIVQPGHADHLRLSAYCGIGHNRALADAGALEIQPAPYSRLGALIRSGAIRADVILVQVSPPNGRGEYSLGLAADYLIPALATARAVVAEVNQQVPWTHAEKLLRREQFSLLVESSRPPAGPRPDKSGLLEQVIATQAAQFIPAGATLEFGTGALPEAACRELASHSRLSARWGARSTSCARRISPREVLPSPCCPRRASWRSSRARWQRRAAKPGSSSPSAAPPTCAAAACASASAACARSAEIPEAGVRSSRRVPGRTPGADSAGSRHPC